jgi:hypothetical protein
MKKLLLSILLLLTFAIPVFATDWYADSGSGAMSTRGWHDTSAGSCAGGSGAALTWASRQIGDVFHANGCTAIAVDADPGANGKVTLSTVTGAGGAGGGFTYVIGLAGATALHVDIVAGTTACLTTSGSTADATNTGDITGGSSVGAVGLSLNHTTRTFTNTGNVLGGGNTTAYGLKVTGASGATSLVGSCTGVTAVGCYQSDPTAQQTLTVRDCIGSNATTGVAGCYSALTGIITVTGNLIYGFAAGIGAAPINGTFSWVRTSAKNYIKIPTSQVPAYLYASPGLASDAAGTLISGANTAAQVKTTAWFADKDSYDGSTLTQGSATSSGGGSWGF